MSDILRAMRYQEVCSRFSSFVQARDAVAREWEISKATVMCVEFDLSSAVRLVVAPRSTQPQETGGAQFVRVTFFDSVGLPVPLGRLSSAELGKAKEYQRTINRWVAGEVEVLPESTSTRMADKFRRT